MSHVRLLDPGDTEMKGRTYIKEGPLVMGETKVNKSSDDCQGRDGRSLGRAPGMRQTVGSALLFPHLQAPSLGEITKLFQRQVLETCSREV